MRDNTFNMTEIEVSEGYGNFSNSKIMDRPYCNALTTSKRYHTRYRTFSLSFIWIGHNATRYHNFNVLLHALPYIFSQFSMVWGSLQCVTTSYRQIYKKYILIFFKKRYGNAW